MAQFPNPDACRFADTRHQCRSARLVGPDGQVWKAENARLYRQHQLHLTDATQRNEQFRPGWYPDALIPLADPLTGKALSGTRLTAVPFDLPAEETHGFWIDLFVPPEAKPGEYRGNWQVTAAEGRRVDVPVTLQVWDFALPRILDLGHRPGLARRAIARLLPPAVRTGQRHGARRLGSRRSCSAPTADGTPHQRHAPGAAGAGGSARMAVSPSPRNRSRPCGNSSTGTTSTRSKSSHPSQRGQGPGSRTRPAACLVAGLGPGRGPSWTVLHHVVHLPERRAERGGRVPVRAAAGAERSGRPSPSSKSWSSSRPRRQDPAWGDLYGAIDIWCPLFPLHDPQTAAERLALGETVWTYTALCQAKRTPWWHTDFPLLNYRVPAWIAWRTA